MPLLGKIKHIFFRCVMTKFIDLFNDIERHIIGRESVFFTDATLQNSLDVCSVSRQEDTCY